MQRSSALLVGVLCGEALKVEVALPVNTHVRECGGTAILLPNSLSPCYGLPFIGSQAVMPKETRARASLEARRRAPIPASRTLGIEVPRYISQFVLSTKSNAPS